jgi:UDP-N-acetyl-D-mannosaminuronic acid transferase (WecB/TagA/CpsF family)
MTQLTERAQSAPQGLVGELVALERRLAGSGQPVRVTWLNHHSIRIALQMAPEAVGEVDVCGIDGQFLQWLLRHPVRTSADLVVPRLLEADPTISTVLAIGGSGDRGDALSVALSREAGRPVTATAVDGFSGLPRGEDLRRLVRDVRPDLVLVGLGAGLQEQVLLEAASAMPRGYALTCGGFLDQVLQEGYYPSWAYPLRLNWLVRVAREPRRLWRRYTIEALSAMASRADWRTSMSRVPGVAVHERMCLGGPGTAFELGAA